MAGTKILLVEDDENDVEIISRVLEKGSLEGVEILVADKRDVFISLLETFSPDLILADYRLPQFSGLEALHLTLEISPFVPFVFVTGAIGEELAAETVLDGAWGFVLKSNLEKLNEVVTDCLFRARQKHIPDRIHSLLLTSNRIKRQIEANKEILNKAKNIIEGQNEPTGNWKTQIQEELDQSRKEIDKIEEWLRQDPDESKHFRS